MKIILYYTIVTYKENSLFLEDLLPLREELGLYGKNKCKENND